MIPETEAPAPAVDGAAAPAIVVEHLTKKFGDFTADDDLNFTVARNEIFGILGPNGAGKSTLIRMLTTLIRPTAGRALVMGFDVARRTNAVRHSIGVIPQANTVDSDLSAWESLDIYGKFYGMSRRERRDRATELLQAVGLWEWKDQPAGTYSGGMRRRLEIARGLVHRPHVFFLDEPTTGLDPQSRRVIWELLEKLRDEGDLTILICTHYMDEADRLCHRLAIIDHGKIAVLGTPRELKASVAGQEALRVEFFREVSGPLRDALRALPGVVDAAIAEDHSIRIAFEGEPPPPETILDAGAKAGNRIKTLSLEEPTLDDVFIHYTGRGLRDTVSTEYVRPLPSIMR